MKWEKWAPHYKKIVERLGLDEAADRKASIILNAMLPKPNIKEFSNILKGQECVVFGAGPSLDKDLGKLSLGGYLDKILITADGATSAVLKYKTPDIIVTDLDGNVDDQLEAWRRGAWLVVHAHGDNTRKIEQIVPKITERILGTTQVKPFDKIFNFGGFTDGDRAAFMAKDRGASKIYLAGMDLGTKVGEYSGEKDSARKLVKLEICKEMLSWLAKSGAKIFNMTSGGEAIPNVTHGHAI